jgi:hypothetical protein
VPSDYLREKVLIEPEEFILNETECTDDADKENDPSDLSDYDHEQVEPELTNWQIMKIRIKTIYLDNPKVINDLLERTIRNLFN